MLAFTRRRNTWIPPFLYMQGRIFGEGVYAGEQDKEQIFGTMLRELTRKLLHKLCFYIEFSDLSLKMFGYRFFRSEGYFPVNWQEVHNSLHSMPPVERLSDKTRSVYGRVIVPG